MKIKRTGLMSSMLAAATIISTLGMATPAFASDVTVNPDSGKGSGNMTVTGTASPVTTMDVTIPVGGINFAIDSKGVLTSQGAVIKSDTVIPLTVNVLSAQSLEAGDATGGLAATTLKAPDLVKADKYTSKQWNNLNRSQTVKEIAIGLKQVDVTGDSNDTAGEALTEATTDALKIQTPVQLGGLTGTDALAHLESGYGTPAYTAVNLEKSTDYTNYGKSWISANDITFRYMTTLEFVFD